MISFQKADKSDSTELLESKIDAFADEVSIYGFGPPSYDSPEAQLAVFDKPNVHYFKILDNTAIIGGICVAGLQAGHYHLSGIYIKSNYQNRGVGSAAIRFLFDTFPDEKKWTLETPHRSFRNHHFYEKFGFKKVGETEPEPDGFYLFLYEK